MAKPTLNGNEIIGYNRAADMGVTVFTKSPTGETTDALGFFMTFSTKEHCDIVTSVLDEIWQARVESLSQGHPIQ